MCFPWSGTGLLPAREARMADVKKDGAYFVDRTGTSALTPDGKPPAAGTQVKISDNQGGHVQGVWQGGQFVKTGN